MKRFSNAIATSLFATLVLSHAAAAGDAGTRSTGAPATLIIVTTDALAPSFERFAAWKSALGIRTEVHTLRAIEAAYPTGRDTPERIRLFLKDAHVAGARWLLLGGDANVVPMRIAFTRFFGGRKIPTDLYYACLDGDWNADGDEFYGEGYVSDSDPGDAADLEPELLVGRAPVQAPEDADAFSTRTAKYAEASTGPGDRRVVVAAEAIPIGPPMDVIDLAPTAEAMLSYLSSDPSREIRRFYTNYDGPWADPAPEPLSQSAVFGAIEKRADLLMHLGRGNETLMAMGKDVIDAGDLASLRNGSDVVHVYSLGSLTAKPVVGSIGASWLRAPLGGAVTFTGPTDLGFLGGLSCAVEFARLVYAEGVGSVGEAAAQQTAILRPFAAFDNVSRLTVMTLELLGDPSLPIRSGIPASSPRAPAGARQIAVTEAAGASTVGLDLGATELTLDAAGQGGRAMRPVSQATLSLSGALPVVGEARFALGPRVSASGETFVIDVIDVAGRRVRALARGNLPATTSTVRWDLRDDAGGRARDGVYFAVLTTAAGRRVQKFVVLAGSGRP